LAQRKGITAQEITRGLADYLMMIIYADGKLWLIMKNLGTIKIARRLIMMIMIYAD